MRVIAVTYEVCLNRNVFTFRNWGYFVLKLSIVLLILIILFVIIILIKLGFPIFHFLSAYSLKQGAFSNSGCSNDNEDFFVLEIHDFNCLVVPDDALVHALELLTEAHCFSLVIIEKPFGQGESI